MSFVVIQHEGVAKEFFVKPEVKTKLDNLKNRMSKLAGIAIDAALKKADDKCGRATALFNLIKAKVEALEASILRRDIELTIANQNALHRQSNALLQAMRG